MKTRIFDGRAEAARIKKKIKRDFSLVNCRLSAIPTLAVVLVGQNPASTAYVRQKEKNCQEVGGIFRLYKLSESADLGTLRKRLEVLNHQRTINGIILQLPLPSHLKNDTQHILNLISPEKDVDGLVENSVFIAPTALAVSHILETAGLTVRGKNIVVLGRGSTAGRPIANLMSKKGAQTFVIHSQTDLSIVNFQLSIADIVISCVGQPGIVKGTMIKPGAVVIGVGLSKLTTNNSQLATFHGDLDVPSLIGKASFLTPTPGGVGPLTVTFLLKNLLEATQKQATS